MDPADDGFTAFPDILQECDRFSAASPQAPPYSALIVGTAAQHAARHEVGYRYGEGLQQSHPQQWQQLHPAFDMLSQRAQGQAQIQAASPTYLGSVRPHQLPLIGYTPANGRTLGQYTSQQGQMIYPHSRSQMYPADSPQAQIQAQAQAQAHTHAQAQDGCDQWSNRDSLGMAAPTASPGTHEHFPENQFQWGLNQQQSLQRHQASTRDTPPLLSPAIQQPWRLPTPLEAVRRMRSEPLSASPSSQRQIDLNPPLTSPARRQQLDPQILQYARLLQRRSPPQTASKGASQVSPPSAAVTVEEAQGRSASLSPSQTQFHPPPAPRPPIPAASTRIANQAQSQSADSKPLQTRARPLLRPPFPRPPAAQGQSVNLDPDPSRPQVHPPLRPPFPRPSAAQGQSADPKPSQTQVHPPLRPPFPRPPFPSPPPARHRSANPDPPQTKLHPPPSHDTEPGQWLLYLTLRGCSARAIVRIYNNFPGVIRNTPCLADIRQFMDSWKDNRYLSSCLQPLLEAVQPKSLVTGNSDKPAGSEAKALATSTPREALRVVDAILEIAETRRWDRDANSAQGIRRYTEEEKNAKASANHANSLAHKAAFKQRVYEPVNTEEENRRAERLAEKRAQRAKKENVNWSQVDAIGGEAVWNDRKEMARSLLLKWWWSVHKYGEALVPRDLDDALNQALQDEASSMEIPG